MERRLQGDIFLSLKQVLKNRKMTYADLARKMEVSEPTIKRMFVERDCKMGRLLKLCDILEVSLSDLIERVRRNPDTAFVLPVQVEHKLAREPILFYLFLLLRDGISEAEICERYDISPSRFFLYMRQLEEMDLARTRHDGKIVVFRELRIQFQRHGPLRRIIRDINIQFLIETFEAPDSPVSAFHTLSRRMLPDTAVYIRQELEQLVERVNRMARQDQMVADDSELKSYKLNASFGPFRLPEILNATKDEEKN